MTDTMLDAPWAGWLALPDRGWTSQEGGVDFTGKGGGLHGNVSYRKPLQDDFPGCTKLFRCQASRESDPFSRDLTLKP